MQLSQSRRMVKSASVRTRFTPTFYHHDIFGTSSPAEPPVRATPTFASSVFDCDGYLIKTNHSRTIRVKQPQQEMTGQHVYVNESRQRKQAFLNPCSDYCPDNRVRCTDQKDRLAQDINHLQGRTSRLRKCIEQMSNPIFGGCSWTPFIPTNLPQTSVSHQVYDPNEYRREKQASPEKSSPKRQQVEQQPPHSISPEPQPQKKVTVASKKPKQSDKSSSKHEKNLKKFKSAANMHRG